MVSVEQNSIKCLMIGAKGIGKTTFLDKFPNSKLSIENHSEIYKINCLNEIKAKKSSQTKQFDYLDIEIQNLDIDCDTLFVVNDLIQSNEKIINTNSHKVIILCFALDDLSSFELIKSKWKFYLKKNTNNQSKFILLGLKSDMINSLKPSVGYVYKERSSSTSSNSSTSKLHLKKIRKRTLSENDSNYNDVNHNEFKKFAKRIGDFKLIQSTNIEHSTDLFKSTKNSIESYVSLSKSICRCYMNKDKQEQPKTKKANKIPRALTAPVNFLVNQTHRSRKPIEDKKELTEQSVVYDKQDERLTMNTNNSLKINESISIKKKFSQLFVGLGTYLVTCGTGKSRQLRFNNTAAYSKQNKTSIIKSKSNLVKKDKSWLLLSSEVSLNNLENDDVFLS